jgi:tRNA (adenine22-N1)-methyltransferase
MISKRLGTIARYVPSGSRLADIGSDHALLPVFLLQNQVCTFAIAGDVSEGPLRAAKQQIARAGFHKSIMARKGNGLAVLEEDEIDVVTIAGMGGTLIRTILETGKQQLERVSMLILQPNVGEETVRRWLHENDWFLTDESILEEDGRIYEVLVAKRIDGARADSERLYSTNDRCLTSNHADWMFRIGPWLLHRNEPLLIPKWSEELLKRQRVVEHLKRSNSAEAQLKSAEIARHINELEGILRCLQMEKQSFG